MHRAFWSICAMAIAIGAAAQVSSEDVSNWPDSKLRQAIESAKPGRENEGELLDAVRRSGADWKKVIVDRNEALSALIERPDKSDPFWRLRSCNLNLLTARRRIEGKPDPLRVLVAGKHKLSHSLHQKLEFSALVVNLDAEKETIHGLTSGGDYRSGRLERWRIEISDEKGKLLPCIQEFGWGGGGLSTRQDLEYGESWQVRLPLRNYVVVDKPGKYKLRLHYHNVSELASAETIEGLITAQSDEIELEITPIRVSATEKEREEAREWIAKLPEEGPVKILMDGVLESPKHLSPTSPAGRLQRMHTDAIPDLIDAALDPELTPGKRAWVLGLLTGITGHNNPCDGFFGGGEILGAYEMISHHSQQTGKRTIDPEKQQAFAEKWRAWKKEGYFTIEKPPAK